MSNSTRNNIDIIKRAYLILSKIYDHSIFHIRYLHFFLPNLPFTYFSFKNNRIKFITSIIFINKNGKMNMLVSVLKIVKINNILVAFWHKDVVEFWVNFVYYQGHFNHIKGPVFTRQIQCIFMSTSFNSKV